MAINRYVGIDGITLEEMFTPQDFYEALDALHSMAMDNESEHPGLLRILDETMKRLRDEYPEIDG